MKLTRLKLKKIIETFIAGPMGVIDLESEPYEYLKGHPDKKLSSLGRNSNREIKKAGVELASVLDDKYADMQKYEEEIRNADLKSEPGEQTTKAYAASKHMSPGYVSTLRNRVEQYITVERPDFVEEYKEYYVEEPTDAIFDTMRDVVVEELAEIYPMYNIGLKDYDFKALKKDTGRNIMNDIDDIVYNQLERMGVYEELIDHASSFDEPEYY